MKALSNLAQSVRASTTLAIDTQFNKMRSEGIDVIGFSVGQPDFPTPEHIKQAGIRAIQENLTKYTPTPGTPAVRKAVADRLDADWGLDYTPEEMFEIFKMRCGKGYVLAPEAEPLVRDYIAEESADPSFGNARGVRNLFEHILVAQNNRLAAMETVTKEDLMTLTQDDVLHARGKLD